MKGEKDPEKIAARMRQLDEELEVLQTKEKLFKCKCVVCGMKGCDVLSFKHKKPAHNKCLILPQETLPLTG